MLDDDNERQHREADALIAAARLCVAASRIRRGAATPEQRERAECSARRRATSAIRDVLHGVPIDWVAR
jgi:hypothetical protein